MKRLLTLVAFFATLHASAQQVNPVPDYVFRNQMSVGRGTVTDTAAYFSIGPRYGANKGFMPPIVVDTATFSSGKRNGLLIFSVQKNKFLYWDSVRVQWSDMAGSSGSYIVAGDTASMLTPYVRQAGYGLTKSGQSFLVDTLNIATRAWRQKGVDSVAGLSRIGGSGTAFYIPRFATSSTLQNSIIYDDGAKVGVGTTSPIGTFQVYKSGAPAYITLTGGSGANQGAAFVIYKSNNSLSLINIGDKAALVGGAPDTAVTFRAGANVPLIFEPNASEALRLNNNQTITATSLAGSGSRIVVADANGTLSASSALSGYVDGSGTTNYIPKFTAGSTIGNSQIFDNGTNVGINTASPASRLHAFGTSGATTIIAEGATNNTAYGRLEMRGRPQSANQSTGYIVAASTEGGQVATNIGAIDFAMSGAGGNAHYVAFSTHNGTSLGERLRIFANGRVGINTTTDAGYQLDVNGTLRSVNGANFATSSGEVLIGTITDAGAFVLQASGSSRLYHPTANIGGVLTSFNGNSENYYDADLHTFRFGNGGGPAMVIRSNAEVAINNPSDAGDYKLQVAGNIYNTGSAVLAATSGNVGIGTASPSAKLTVVGAGAQTILNSGSVADARMEFHYNSGREGFISWDTDNLRLQADAGNYLTFYTNATEAMRITSGGNVGIGTASPAQKLDVSGVIRANSGTIYAQASGTESSGYQLNAITLGYDATNTIGWITAGGTAARTNLVLQQSGGEVLIGTATDAGNYKLQVSGNIYNTGSAVLAATSGNVGIGTASPQQILHANATTGAYIQLSRTAQGGTTSPFGGIYFGDGTTFQEAAILSGADGNVVSGNMVFYTRAAAGSLLEVFRINSTQEMLVGGGSDAGDYKLQVSGNIYNTGSITTGAPSGGSIKPWKIGEAATVSPTSPNRTIRVEIDGVVYYLHAKTTND